LDQFECLSNQEDVGECSGSSTDSTSSVVNGTSPHGIVEVYQPNVSDAETQTIDPINEEATTQTPSEEEKEDGSIDEAVPNNGMFHIYYVAVKQQLCKVLLCKVLRENSNMTKRISNFICNY
jgi:hypothetical protein